MTTATKLSFENCAQYIAGRLFLHSKSDAFGAARNLGRDNAHDAEKLLERAREILIERRG
jgi:hypothetical protein